MDWQQFDGLGGVEEAALTFPACAKSAETHLQGNLGENLLVGPWWCLWCPVGCRQELRAGHGVAVSTGAAGKLMSNVKLGSRSLWVKEFP